MLQTWGHDMFPADQIEIIKVPIGLPDTKKHMLKLIQNVIDKTTVLS